MARILDLFLGRKANRTCETFPDSEALFNGLKREESAAIQCLSSRIGGSVFNIGQQNRLSDDEIEELICDCISILIEKIRNGKYQFQGYSPATFAVEIAKNRARTIHRDTARFKTAELTASADRADEPDYATHEQKALLDQLLNKMGDNCQRLIRLKFLEEIRDKEAIEQKMTQYSTVDALKNHRAQCMKKLVELGASTSFFNTF